MECSDGLRFSDLEEYSSSDDDFGDRDEVDRHPESRSSNLDPRRPKIVGERHLNEMKKILGLDQFTEKKSNKSERKRRAKLRKRASEITLNGQKVIQTLATRIKTSVSAPQLVNYEDPRKRKRKRLEEQEAMKLKNLGASSKSPDEILPNLTMKEARFDVFKFGIAGLDKAGRDNAETERLIALGAKPAKRPCIQYQELKEIRKKEKEEKSKQMESKRLTGVLKTNSLRNGTKVKNKLSSGTKQKKVGKKKNKGSKESIMSKVGSFDGGMLKLSAKDLAKIKGGK